MVFIGAAPSAAGAQLRWDAPVQPVGEARAGDLLFGTGIAFGANGVFPLSGLSGDLLSLGRMDLVYALADGAIVEIRGDVRQILSIENRVPAAIDLRPSVDDSTTGDSGDFRVGTQFILFGGRRGLAGGARFEVTLPNSNERLGIGTNSTAFRASLLASYGSGPVRATADVGVGILEAPLKNFEQNDVIEYSGELLVRLLGGRVRLNAGLDGRVSTRGLVPLGTEDRGTLSFGADLAAGAWLFDTGFDVGYAGSSPDWGFGIGIARRWHRGSP